MNKKLIIIGNWKMYKTIHETKTFMNQFKNLYEKHQAHIYKNLVFGIAPNFISIKTLHEFPWLNSPSNLCIVAQNMSQYNDGPYTGETSITMIKDAGVKMVILGHSERRANFGETNEIVNKKVLLALEHQITPIICVGETLEEYENNKREKVVEDQLIKSLKGVKDFNKIIIAYEPIWAIGTGKTATTDDAQKMCQFIRSKTDDNVIIQYGGSVNPKNIQDLMQQPDINGALVGGASLQPETMIQLLMLDNKTN